ncbi:hypothetical protein ES703_116698 [subsurface metagenome]
MLWTLISVIPIGLVVYVLGYYSERHEARAQADEFIASIRKPTPKDIDKCIGKLQVANRRLLDRNETDRRRVELLIDMRGDILTKPG